MASRDQEDNKQEQAGKPKRWRSLLAAALLVLAGLTHSFMPKSFALDWPAIALILSGVFLAFVPIEDLGEYLESLEIGKTKLLFRQSRGLDRSVETAEKEQLALPLDSLEASAQTSSLTNIKALLAADSEMALIRIGIELEQVLGRVFEQQGGKPPQRGLVWRTAIDGLMERGVISRSLGKACIDFRNMRNRLIHPTGEKIPESLIASTVDSGVRLLQIFSALDRTDKPR